MTIAVAGHALFPNLRVEVAEGYLHAPEHVVVEVIDGELHAMPRPRRRHTRVASKLGAGLDGPFDAGREGPGGWVTLDEPEIRLGRTPDILVPNLAGWRRERVPEDFFSEEAPAYFDLAPDWVCEVLSESTEAIDRGRKMRIYRREGVSHLWLLDPRFKSLEVWTLDAKRWREVDTFEGDVRVRAEPFEAIELDLSALWAL